VRFALIQIGPPAHVTVGQREHRFGLGQQVQVRVSLPDVPRLYGEYVLRYHWASIGSRALAGGQFGVDGTAQRGEQIPPLRFLCGSKPNRSGSRSQLSASKGMVNRLSPLNWQPSA
jgi:hypothetical protein